MFLRKGEWVSVRCTDEEAEAVSQGSRFHVRGLMKYQWNNYILAETDAEAEARKRKRESGSAKAEAALKSTASLSLLRNQVSELLTTEEQESEQTDRIRIEGWIDEQYKSMTQSILMK